MAALLPLPEVQLIDANGKPMVGASIYTYIPSSSTPKATWSEPTGTALNTNPVITDASGRAILYGDGDYRVLVRDAVGNEIYDQPSSTLVSAAMAPVIAAPTIADAVHLLGLDDTVTAAELASSVAVETARAAAADGRADHQPRRRGGTRGGGRGGPCRPRSTRYQAQGRLG